MNVHDGKELPPIVDVKRSSSDESDVILTSIRSPMNIAHIIEDSKSGSETPGAPKDSDSSMNAEDEDSDIVLRYEEEPEEEEKVDNSPPNDGATIISSKSTPTGSDHSLNLKPMLNDSSSIDSMKAVDGTPKGSTSSPDSFITPQSFAPKESMTPCIPEESTTTLEKDGEAEISDRSTKDASIDIDEDEKLQEDDSIEGIVGGEVEKPEEIKEFSKTLNLLTNDGILETNSTTIEASNKDQSDENTMEIDTVDNIIANLDEIIEGNYCKADGSKAAITQTKIVTEDNLTEKNISDSDSQASKNDFHLSDSDSDPSKISKDTAASEGKSVSDDTVSTQDSDMDGDVSGEIIVTTSNTNHSKTQESLQELKDSQASKNDFCMSDSDSDASKIVKDTAASKGKSVSDDTVSTQDSDMDVDVSDETITMTSNTNHIKTQETLQELTDCIQSDSISTKESKNVHKHRATEPNVMIHIPSQEMKNIDDSLNSSNSSENINSSLTPSNSGSSELNNEILNTIQETSQKQIDDTSKTDPKAKQVEQVVKNKLADNELDCSSKIDLLVGEIDQKSSKVDQDDNESSPDEDVLEKLADILETSSNSSSTNSLKIVPTSSNKITTNDSELGSKMMETSETITATSEDVTSTSNLQFQSPSKEVLPPHAKEVASPSIKAASESRSKEVSSPTTEAALPSKEVAAPSKEVAAPSKEVAAPCEEVASPSKEAESPSKEAESPTKDLEDVETFIKEVQPVQSSPINQMEPDSPDEVPETDSLGLLAESSRVMDDDDADDPDTPEEDDDDEDGDPDYDESSNQADQSENNSEESNQMAETEQPNVVPSLSDDTIDFFEKESLQSADDMQNVGIISFSMAKIGNDASDMDTVAEMDKERDIDITDELSVASNVVEEMDSSDVPLDTQDVADDIKEGEEDKTKESAVPPKAPTTPKPIVTDDKVSATILEKILTKDKENVESPSKKVLAISQTKNVVNYVDLEESSEDDDVQETVNTEDSDSMTSVNIPTSIEIMASGEVVSEIKTVKGEIVISGVPKPTPHKLTRLNTDEITIKTGTATDSIVIPEAKIGKSADVKAPKLGLEVFNIDSDEDEAPKAKPSSPSPKKGRPATPKKSKQCINPSCEGVSDVSFYPASRAVLTHFETGKKRGVICEYCFAEVIDRAESLIDGVKNFTPLLELNMRTIRPDLVEISDSDDEEDTATNGGEKIGFEFAMRLEKELATILNETWHKYHLDERLQEAQEDIDQQIDKLNEQSKEVSQMLAACQLETDKLREGLYATFEPNKETVPGIIIYDTPDRMFVCQEPSNEAQPAATPYVTRQAKRRLSSAAELPAKKQAVPLTQTATDNVKTEMNDTKEFLPKLAEPSTSADSKLDDDKEDVSVVHLSAELAPPSLPPLGPLVRPPLQTAAAVYAMRNAFGSWIRARVVEITPKGTTPQATQFSMIRVRFENKSFKTPCKVLPARCIAYPEPAPVRMTIGTRCIALFKDSTNAKRMSYYSGVVAEVPNPVNNYRYLVFFDDGYAQYVQHQDTRLVVESASVVWEEVHPFSREFVRKYLMAYPERPMVRLHTGQNIKTEWNGKWWITRVLQVDASLVQVHFQEDNRKEWIYRGSTRLAPLFLELQAAERTRNRPMPRNRQARQHLNMPYVEYTRSDEQEATRDAERLRLQQERLEQEIRRQRAVAKKSTAPAPQPAAANATLDTVTSRVVYYTPKMAVKPLKMVPHTCSPRCRRTDVLALSDLRTYNPLAKPLLSGWERQLVRLKGHKEVMYRAPCGRRLRDIQDLHRYLRVTNSDMGVDLFDFSPATHCLAEFVLNKCIVGKKDLSHGKENVPVPCVNYYDDSLPEFCSYNTERTPTAGVPLNLDPDFLCGCDCTDDCQDKSKCACWQMTLEGARTIGMDQRRVGYEYKRLLEPLPTGIYECNARCKCKHTCLNRVAQHPLQLKLQVFKTLNRGWGIRALNDVPKGAFLCVYAGNLLTDATANLDGLNEGDEYLAELDYIEVVEQMKEGFEEDIPDRDKQLDKKESGKESSPSPSPSSSEDEGPSKDEREDNDFQPGYIPQPQGSTIFNKRLRKRDKLKKEAEKQEEEQKKEEKDKGKDSEECITISDDEELREPSRFMAESAMDANEFSSKLRSLRSMYGKDEACYIMDAKVQGNIGRYLNHSCSPNVFVQNVFVDTHDPRFPWVAFFALSHIKAGTELTWNYNYDIGSVPGKTLYCYCGANNCRGRLL